MALKFLPPEEHGLSTSDSDADVLEIEDEAAAPQLPTNGNGNGHSSTASKEQEDAYSTRIMAEARRLIDQVDSNEQFVAVNQSDAPPCSTCGSIMVRNGSCYKCLNCGTTSGCS